MKTMTSRQTWAIFCLSKIDVRNADIDMDKASALIDSLKQGGEQFEAAIAELKAAPGAVVKGEAKPKQDWQALYDKAHAAGLAAGQGIIPVPMTVVQHENPLNDDSPITRQWHVSEGVCGFAWVTVRPANSSFALWLKKQQLGSKAYHGGLQIWVHQFNQSMERKEAYAHAFASVLTAHGISAYAGSRLD